MQSKVDNDMAMSMPGIEEARQYRARVGFAARWARHMWDRSTPGLPDFTLKGLSQLPTWAIDKDEAIERLALITGALFAAPALRVCLQPGPLLRVRTLIGAATLEQVLAVADLPRQGMAWHLKEGEEHDGLYTWGAGLMVNSIEDPSLRQAMSRHLGMEINEADMLPPAVAARMVQLGQRIAQGLEADPQASSADEEGLPAATHLSGEATP